MRGEKLARRGGKRDLGAGSEQRHKRRTAVRRNQFVGAGRAAIALVEALPELRRVLPRQGQHARPMLGLQRELPALDGFDTSQGRNTLRLGIARNAARCSTG